MTERNLYRGKRVLVTGHTGFKGSWLVTILAQAGADVTGYSLDPPTDPNLYTLSGVGDRIRSIRGDVRDPDALQAAFDLAKPDIVFHLAAQPIVRTSYREPRLTYETNVMGTVNVCECIRRSDTVRSFLNVTTDKVYENREWVWGYRENEPLDGYDPYSNSKSCSELVTHSYRKSFFEAQGVAVSTARAGNVIGGGDFAEDRIVPDCVRAVTAGRRILVRNPHSVRPYQHVLEPLAVYLMIAAEQYVRPEAAGSYNVGPDEADAITTGELADLFCADWGEGSSWYTERTDGPHEANYLKLDCSKLKAAFGWRPRWNVAEAVRRTVDWSKVWIRDPASVPACMEEQIRAFFKEEERSSHV
jgi:CDP-glucose 4,6-dehydratase